MITKRSIILGKVTTSISMEPAFWEEVDRRAQRSCMAWQDYVRQLLGRAHDKSNRSAAIRVGLLRQLVEEGHQKQGSQRESWWFLSTPSGSREIGARGSQFTVGRSGGNTIIVDDPEVSRRHLLIVFDGEFWRAVDMESKNGLLVNGQRVRAARVTPGMSLHFGESELRLLN